MANGQLAITVNTGTDAPRGGVLEVVATLTMEGGAPVPEIARATIRPDPSTVDVSGKQTQTFKRLAPPNLSVGTITFYVVIPSELEIGSPVKLTVSIENNGAVTAAPVTATLLVTAAKRVTYSSAPTNPSWLRINRGVIAPNRTRSLHYSATVHDSDDQPVEDGYVVEWREVWDSGAFDVVKAYSDPDGAFPLTAVKDDLGHNSRFHTKTVGGIANLYIVAGADSTYFQVWPVADISNTSPRESIIVFDPQRSSTRVQEPYLAVDQDANGNLDFDSVDGAFLAATAYHLDTTYFEGTTIKFMFFSSTVTNPDYVVSIKEHNFAQFHTDRLSVSVAKGSFLTGTELEDRNTFYYVVGNPTAGVLVSQKYRFYATGQAAANMPDPNIQPRDLPMPTILKAGAYVNLNTIEDGNLNIEIPLFPSPDWVPAAGDTVTVSIYLNGTNASTGAVQNAAHRKDVTVRAADVSAGKLLVQFASSLIAGFDSFKNPASPGTFYAEYFANPQVGGQQIYSKYVEKFLDTAAPQS